MSSFARLFLPLLCAILFMLSFAPSAIAQDAASKTAAPATPPAAQAAAESETPQQKLDRSWQLITNSAGDAKHTDTRVQALAAISTLGNNARANHLLADAMRDPDVDVRTAAVLAAGKTKSPALVQPIHQLLNDAEPQVVFTAATTLWTEFKDHAGEDILAAIADGERKATPGLIHGARHDMSKTMHSPSTMAKLGAESSAGLLLGPFGFSVAAVEYMHKNGSDDARIKAVQLIAQDKSDAVREEMLDALSDKDPGVRAAAVKALGDYRSRSLATAVGPLIDDPKLPVRLTAAAAYINCMGGTPTPAHR